MAILAVPVVFVWLLLLPGYARSTRIAGFTYAFLPPALGVCVRLLLLLAGR